MCLILLAYQQHPEFPLILIANRDEHYQRPTQEAQYWEDYPEILGGRDLNHKGTWLGINQKGYFAAVTNYRSSIKERKTSCSRGLLVSDYLQGRVGTENYIDSLISKKQKYGPFNLIAGNHDTLFFLSSRENQPRKLTKGFYGISNGDIDSAWPKSEKGKRALKIEVESGGFHEQSRLFSILSDTTVPADDSLPDTGVGLELERQLGPVFIDMSEYGTRASTILMITNQGKVSFTERNYDSNGSETSTNNYEFDIEPRT